MEDVQTPIQMDQQLPILPLAERSQPLDQFYVPTVTTKEDPQDSETREPLRELNKNDEENQDNPEQEQEEDEEENGQEGEKSNDYVAKVLEKLMRQRNKMSRLSLILEKKGLIGEKKLSQIQNIAQQFEEIACDKADDDTGDDENTEDISSKENLSPTRSKHSAKVSNHGSETASPTTTKPSQDYSLEDVLQISRKDISFGTRFPGQIVEEHLDIVNKSGHDFIVQIIVTCQNEDLQNTEEYVYSVRRSNLYDYNDKHYLIMAPYSCAGFKFALKVPDMKLSGKIIGKVKISIQGVPGCFVLNLNTDVAIPRVFCPKELSFKGLDYKIIKLAIKEGKKHELKMPIRNNGDVPVTLELEFYDPTGSREAMETPQFDCLVFPNVITIGPKNSALTSVVIKPCRSSSKAVDKPKSSRKIMIGRVRDSSLFYSFVFWIETF